jgi:hypothetical protein
VGKYHEWGSNYLDAEEWHIAGAADFSGDGQADLVWENTTTGQRAIWQMKNGGFFTAINLPTIDPRWHIVDH